MAQENSTEFSNAVSQLTLSNIFFTALFYNLKVIREDELEVRGMKPPMCTDGVNLIYSASRFAEMFKPAERVSVLAHEILHVILYHALRRGIRDPQLWNIACDFAVNALLHEYNFPMGATITVEQGKAGKEGWLLDMQFKGWSAEKIYDWLLQDQKKDGKGGGGQGQGQDKLHAGPTGQDVQDYDPSAAGNEGKSVSEIEREVGIATEKAMQAAKAAGKLPSGMKAMMEDAQVVREPWYQHLRRYMTSLNSRQYNWSRLDARRAVMFGICSPSMRTESMGKIVASIDESGSMSDTQRAAVGAHLRDLCRECHPKSLVLIQHDSRVHKVTEIEGPEYDISMERVCCGGTDFRPVFDEIEADHGDAQVVLMFTDLDGPAGDCAPAADVLWISPYEKKMPFGEIIHADFND